MPQCGDNARLCCKLAKTDCCRDPTSASWNTSVAACAAGATASATADSAAADARGTCKHKLLAEVQGSSVDQCIKYCMILVRHARNSTALHNCAVFGLKSRI